MKSLLILIGILSVCISTCYAKDLIVGTSYNNRLVWQQKTEYNAIPFKKRVKDVFYSDQSNQMLIKGVLARDIDHTDASAIITAGGVGFSYVNIRFKSDRGSGLNYQIEIYA